MVMRLIDKSSGTITFDGEDIGTIPAKQFSRLPLRKRIQMVFQDRPTASIRALNRRARHHGSDLAARRHQEPGRHCAPVARKLAREVGLPPELL